MIRILIVDDEKNQRELLSSSLSDDYETITAASGREALDVFKVEKNIGIVISDFKMPEMDGLELLKKTRQISPDIIFILVTAYASVSSAIAALKQGAYDYIAKPIVIEKLKSIIKRAADNYYLLAENRELKERLKLHYSFESIIVKSHKMKEILSIVSRVSESKTTVLITGESGTGKELIARAIHNASSRRNENFVPINCSAIPETLFESELFGFEKGAFTGAVKNKKGKLELANKGTAFFDEVGDVPLGFQVKLLRFLQFGEIVRLGKESSVSIDARIICATNQNLKEKIEEGSFREDLYYRLNVVEIHIPPLRERKEDITPLVNHFVDKYKKISGKDIDGVSKEAMRYIFEHNWAGNVRELESVVERAIVMSRDSTIDVDDLPIAVKTALEDSGSLTLESLEKKHIEKILTSQGGNISKAALVLGIHRNTLMAKIKQYGIKKQ